MSDERCFRKMLEARQKLTGSLACIGLDPLPEKLPACLRRGRVCDLWQQVAEWMMEIVDATAPYASCYKPQRAHWEAIPCGERGLRAVIAHIKEDHPTIPVILDCKRGDIDRTQQRYRETHFTLDGADAVNFSPYMGKSCMAGLVDKDYLGRGLVGLCYTSNPDAREVQDALLADGRPFWEHVAMWTLKWSHELGVVENAGLVMAAAYPLKKEFISSFQFGQRCKPGDIYSYHLSRMRQLVGNLLWCLVPGVGTQGGALNQTIKAGYAGFGSMAINSSSDIIFASSGDDFAEAAGAKAMELAEATKCLVADIKGGVA